ncbi:MAG: MarC family protein [Bacteroidota bacterium]
MVKEILSVSLILFSIIDIIGNLPIIISLKEKGHFIEPLKTALASGLIMILFLFSGESILSLFGVDIGSFAIAGAIVLFIIGLEMILGASFFKESSDQVGSASIFPLAFPLIAGAGTLTTILSLKAEFETMNILVGILVNILIIFVVMRISGWLQKVLGNQGAAILKKVFGIILLAIAIKLFKSNFTLG